MRFGIFCGVLAVALFATSPVTRGQSRRSKSDKDLNLIGRRNIDRDANIYSLEREKNEGEQLSKNVAKSLKFVTDPAIVGYLERVDHILEQNSDKHIPMTLNVIDSDDAIHPRTMLGGQLFITRGLLVRMDGEGELASMLARAIAVTALRSETSLATEQIESSLSEAPVNGGFPDAGGLAISGGPDTIQARQDAVFDADYFGIQYLYKSGYDPNCFLEFVQQVGDPSKTAPPIPKRLKALQKEIAEILPKRDHNIVTTPEFQQFKNRLQALTQQSATPTGPGGQL